MNKNKLKTNKPMLGMKKAVMYINKFKKISVNTDKNISAFNLSPTLESKRSSSPIVRRHTVSTPSPIFRRTPSPRARMNSFECSCEINSPPTTPVPNRFKLKRSRSWCALDKLKKTWSETDSDSDESYSKEYNCDDIVEVDLDNLDDLFKKL